MVESLRVPVILRAKPRGVPFPVEPHMGVRSARRVQTERDQPPITPLAEEAKIYKKRWKRTASIGLVLPMWTLTDQAYDSSMQSEFGCLNPV